MVTTPAPVTPTRKPAQGPLRPAADLTSGKLLTSHVPPRGHVTLTYDTLAANTHKRKQRNGSKLMYLSFLCTCLIFVRCH